MSRLLPILLIAFLTLSAPAKAQDVQLGDAMPSASAAPDNTAARSGLQGEYLILVGGPALRSFEDLRRPVDRHDRWWANFISAANIRSRQLIDAGVPAASITWLVYRPAYESRQREEGKPLTRWISELAERRGVRLVWFSNQQQLVSHINNGFDGRRTKIASFDFFGHSNKHCFLFDYGNEVLGASVVWLHERELPRLINRNAFHRKAFCKSWGCHSAESMSRAWKRATGTHLWGAVGKTNYVPTGRGELPVISTPGGRWGR